jgi:hypothetical protein
MLSVAKSTLNVFEIRIFTGQGKPRQIASDIKPSVNEPGPGDLKAAGHMPIHAKPDKTCRFTQ